MEAVPNISNDTQREEEIITRKYLNTDLLDGLTCYLRSSRVFKRLMTSYATKRLWGNSYIYTPWAVITTKIHKATEHSRHLRLPKVLWILTDNTDRSYCTYTALHLWTATTLWASQLSEVTTSPNTPAHRWLKCSALRVGGYTD